MIVVIVEGPSDKGFIEGLCGRLRVKCLVLIMRGNRFDKAKRLLRIYEGQHRIIVKDLKGSPRALDKIARELGEAGAKVVVAVKELEAWILAGLCYSNAEEIPDPSWELRRAKGVLKSEHTYREIAMSLDLERAKANSPSFRKLLEQLSPKHSWRATSKPQVEPIAFETLELGGYHSTRLCTTCSMGGYLEL